MPFVLSVVCLSLGAKYTLCEPRANGEEKGSSEPSNDTPFSKAHTKRERERERERKRERERRRKREFLYEQTWANIPCIRKHLHRH